MKRILLLSMLSTFFLSSISSQIIHVDYGEEGMAIPMNANFAFDINQDGLIDIHINSDWNELGFTPVFERGCVEGLTTPFLNWTEYEKTSWGSYKVRTIEKGEVIGLTSANIDPFIEEGNAGIYNSELGPDEGWTDGSEAYLSIVVMDPIDYKWGNGWLLVELDIKNESLILKEYAYQNPNAEEKIIIAGDTGAIVAVDDLSSVLTELKLQPNPATDFIHLSYNYKGQEDLSVSIFDSRGKEILSQTLKGSRVSFDCSEWDAGIYLVNLHSSVGVQTERILVSK